MQKTLNIEGMMCPHCEARVRDALLAVAGVESATVSHESGTAAVTGNTTPEALTSAVSAVGNMNFLSELGGFWIQYTSSVNFGN